VSGVDELVRWLGDRLDDDERIARAACWDEQSDVWTASPPRASYERYTVVDYCDDGVVVVTPENADADGVGRYVAEWDPARVLREIDSKRRLVNAHARGHECIELSGSGEHSVTDGKPWEHWEPQHTLDHGPCFTLRTLALPYADRSGYEEALAAFE
jgi:hypothetical protein